MMCGFLHFAPSLMTFCVITLCWPLGTAQYKVVSNNKVTACLTWYSAVQQAKVVIGVVAYCHTVSLRMATQSDVKSMRCDSVFACEGFCTKRNPSPIGVSVWSFCNIIGEVVYVVPCFQQWQGMMMKSDADAQLCPLHIIRGPSQKKCTERNTYRIEHQMCGKVL